MRTNLTSSNNKTSKKFAPAEVIMDKAGDGGFVLRNPQPLKLTARCLSDFLINWAQQAPDREFLMERNSSGDWVGVTYSQALKQVQNLAAFLLSRGLSPDNPLLILSGNSVRHGLLTLAAMHVGIPVVPVSVSYSLYDNKLTKLRHIVAITRPGLAYADDEVMFSNALEFLASEGISILSDDGEAGFDDALRFEPGPEVKAANALVNHDTVGKFLFTSGSTGMPKGVIVTQKMMLATQQALVQVWPFLEEEPPVIVDWLPWNHTFGGNFNFNQILWNGGTFYIDDGKPLPGEIEKTMRNIRDVSPTMFFNVPSGFDMMLPMLRDDTELCEAFFRRLQLIFYSGAGLPDHLWEGIEELGLGIRGEKVPFVSAWGATEAMLITCVYYPTTRAGIIGLPVPGYEVKFLPNGGKLEMRVRGPHVTPGYLNDPEKTKAAFDDEQYYLIGDAGRLADEADPAKGIVFDGRTSENFKLLTGTWVAVGNLRLALLEALKPVVSDAIITGQDRNEVGALLFLNADECSALTSRNATLAEFAADKKIRSYISDSLACYNETQTGSATLVQRVLLLPDTPSIEKNEITDKGYINQRMALDHRAAAVDQLYHGSPELITPAAKQG